MRQLRFVALAEDGAAIVLSDDNGEQYRLAVDERLKAASRGDGVRLGQIEIMMNSSMRPAEIQARVRAGEAPEEIARAGSMPVERVLRFAGPVLQERAQIVQRARASRCRPLADGEAPVLGELIESRLAERGLDPDSAVWDAARRDNGTWRIAVSWGSGRQGVQAGWVYDPAVHQARANNDSARELMSPTPSAGAGLGAGGGVGFDPVDIARPLAVVRPVAPARAEAPVVAEPAAGAPPAADEVAKHVSIPSWDDIVFGVRGRK